MSEINGQKLKLDSFKVEPWTCFRHGAWKHRQPELGGHFFCHFLKKNNYLSSTTTTTLRTPGAFVNGLP